MTDPMPFDVEALCAALARETDLYGQMLDLSRSQETAAETGDAEALSEVVSRKNTLMEKLEALAEQSEPMKKSWQDAKDRIAPADRDRADRALANLGELLKEILDIDDRTRRTMEGMKEEVARSLRQVQGARHAAQAYKPPPPQTGSRFTDTET